MALRRNDWTIGAFCARYCGFVTAHHGLEDAAIFPHLVRSEPSLGPVIGRLREEHIPVSELSLHLPSLDEVFLTLTGRTAGDDETTEEAA